MGRLNGSIVSACVRLLGALVLVASLHARVDACDSWQDNYFDGFNFGGGAYGSYSEVGNACETYCDGYNDWGGYCYGVEGYEYEQFDDDQCSGSGYCQCAYCVIVP